MWHHEHRAIFELHTLFPDNKYDRINLFIRSQDIRHYPSRHHRKITLPHRHRGSSLAILRRCRRSIPRRPTRQMRHIEKLPLVQLPIPFRVDGQSRRRRPRTCDEVFPRRHRELRLGHDYRVFVKEEIFRVQPRRPFGGLGSHDPFVITQSQTLRSRIGRPKTPPFRPVSGRRVGIAEGGDELEGRDTFVSRGKEKTEGGGSEGEGVVR
mmetsp:Transcript_26821/g.48633  ORF Transcript_26821/g.48633 Transcript_26821/m.48633 type:complete len:209 (+) Transcript_26821:2039-2665(+)